MTLDVGITAPETQHWSWEWYPSGPRNFAKRCVGAGWEVRIGFSRGYHDDAVRDTIGVWVNGYGRRGAAFWDRDPEADFSARKLASGVKPGEIPSGMSWKSGGGWVLLGPGRTFTYASLADMDEWIKVHGAVLPGWYESVARRVQAQHDRTRAAAKARTSTNGKRASEAS